MVKKDENIDRVKAEAAGHHQRISNAGGALAYSMEYINHIAALKGDGEHVVIRERKASYPKMAVQLAAIGAVQNARKADADSETQAEVEKWARAAWAHSAGHYMDPPSGTDDHEVVEHPNSQSMAMIRKGADTRKAKAAEQWDRLIGSDVESLATLALFGHEAAKPVSRRDRWIAYAILAGLVAAIAAYGMSNSYLAVKIDKPFDSEVGFQQHRDATSRVLNYTSLMSSTARKSGIFKLILDWPMSPTESEQEAFTKFGQEVVTSWRNLAEVGNLICGGAEPPRNGLLKIIKNVNDGIDLNDEPIGTIDRYESMIIKSLLRTYPAPAPCK